MFDLRDMLNVEGIPFYFPGIIIQLFLICRRRGLLAADIHSHFIKQTVTART
tara:strand:- start:132403 stop:132558 length:156 start_codon:yes stop_codon:yes gene_type:complete